MATLSDNTGHPTFFARSLEMSDNPCYNVRFWLSFHWKWIFDCKGGIWDVSDVTSAVVVRGLKKCQTAKLEFTSNFSVFDWKAKIFSIFLSLTNKCFSDPLWGPKRLIINTTLFKKIWTIRLRKKSQKSSAWLNELLIV